MIGLSGFGFRRKPRTFDSHPMYWNAEEEERKERLAAQNKSEDEYQVGSIIREGRIRRMRSSQKAQTKSGSILLRSLIFLLLLGAVLYIMVDCFGLFA